MNNNNNDTTKLNTDLRVLEERVAKNEEILNIRLRSYKNYAIIVGALLTLLGIASLLTVINQVVKSTTETKLDQILTEKYVEEKILQKSKPVLDKLAAKLIAQTEKKAQKILDESLSYSDWREKTVAAIECKNYALAIKCIKKGIEKIYKISSMFRPESFRKELYWLHSDIAEMQIFEEEYRDALENAKNTLSFTSNNADKMISHFLICIAKKLLNEDISQVDENFNKSLGKKYNITWEFDLMEEWLEKSDISSDKKAYIIKKMELAKQCDQRFLIK